MNIGGFGFVRVADVNSSGLGCADCWACVSFGHKLGRGISFVLQKFGQKMGVGAFGVRGRDNAGIIVFQFDFACAGILRRCDVERGGFCCAGLFGGGDVYCVDKYRL